MTEDLLVSSKRLFDAWVQRTDGATAARLRAARQRAVRAAAPRAWLAGSRLWLPVAAAAALLAVLILPRTETGAPPAAERDFAAVAAADLEILLADAELEMLAELEFYEWLDLENGEPDEAQAEDGVG